MLQFKCRLSLQGFNFFAYVSYYSVAGTMQRISQLEQVISDFAVRTSESLSSHVKILPGQFLMLKL